MTIEDCPGTLVSVRLGLRGKRRQDRRDRPCLRRGVAAIIRAGLPSRPLAGSGVDAHDGDGKASNPSGLEAGEGVSLCLRPAPAYPR